MMGRGWVKTGSISSGAGSVFGDCDEALIKPEFNCLQSPNISHQILLITGHSAALSGWEEPDSHQSGLHPLWLLEAHAHVPHGHARHDQSHSLPG